MGLEMNDWFGALARPFAGVETIFVPWREADEAEVLGAAHVGIMPLPDDPYARGKCGAKGLQCMAVGLPVVLSLHGEEERPAQPLAVGVREGLHAGHADGWQR